tara:strand:+ start:450 stop:1025 length:576 start_codon:yes stop_codon:yes gene_type:complete
MEVIPREVFPILFYEFIFSQDQIIPLCKEIQDKKKIIKKRHDDQPINPEDEVVDYWTDFNDPIKLLEYEKLIEEISSQFLPEMDCKHVIHWSAIYGKRGWHGTHSHNPLLYDFSSCNMSSILYLSDIGHTDFFNPRQSDELYRTMSWPSKKGRMTMFPSHILHHAMPHGKKDEERIIVSSNWQVIKKDQAI